MVLCDSVSEQWVIMFASQKAQSNGPVGKRRPSRTSKTLSKKEKKRRKKKRKRNGTRQASDKDDRRFSHQDM